MLAALLISEIAAVKAVVAAALSLAAIAPSTFLIAVLTLERIALLRSAFLRSTYILFFADFMLAISFTPPNREIFVFHQTGHGRL